MPRLLLLAAALTLALPPAAAAQTMRHTALPASGTLEARADRPLALLDLRARVVAESGVQDCFGQLDPSAPDAVVTWAGRGPLRIDARSGFDSLLLVRAPDGRWHCNDDSDGLMPALEIPSAPRGRYAVWVAAFSNEHHGEAVTLRAGRPAPTPAPDARARAQTRLAARGGFESTSGALSADVRAGGLDAVSAMGLPSADYCTGFVDAAAPTAVVTYTAGGPRTLSISAQSGASDDLVMLVRTPAGTWRCNDDYGSTDPQIGFEGAAPGDYAVWVGTYLATPRRATSPARLVVAETIPELPSFEFDEMDGYRREPFSEGAYDPSAPPGDGQTRLDAAAAPHVRLALAAGQERASAAATVRPSGDTPVQGVGCVGRVEERPTAAVTLAGDGPFVITAAPPENDFADLAMALRTPSGQWYCSDDADGLNPGVQIEAAEAGTYLVWAGPLVRLDEPTAALTVAAYRGALPEPSFDDLAGMGSPPEPVYGTGTYAGRALDTTAPATPTVWRGRGLELLVALPPASGRVANPVEGDYCRGFVPAAPTLWVQLEAGSPVTVSASPHSDTDLVLLVLTPRGEWICSDDAFGADPALRVDEATSGVYGVWVGTFAEDAPGGPATVYLSR